MNRMKKACLLLLLLLGAVCAGCSKKGEEAAAVFRPAWAEVRAEGREAWSGRIAGSFAGQFMSAALKEIAEASREAGFLEKWAGHFAYDSLTKEEQIWYRDIANILGGMEKDGKLSQAGLDAGLDISGIDTIFQSVMIDHPELFFVDGYVYQQHFQGSATTAIDFSGTYTMDGQEAQARRDEIKQAAAAWLAGISEQASDYDKIKYVYESVIRNTEYDLKAEDNQNIYSVFVNHRSVCQGYAKAAQYLLLQMGIECVLVQGSVDTGEAHSWNLVKADGDYYYMDATWGDASYQMREGETGRFPGDEISYDYLCVTTKQLLRTHILGSILPMPVCVAMADNYYVRENAFFSSYDEGQLTALFRKAQGQQRRDVVILCSDVYVFEEMKRILIEEQKIFDFMEGGVEISYVCNEKQLSFVFWT